MVLGIGWRYNLAGRIGLIGSLEGVVDIRLRRLRIYWIALLPLPCSRIAVSLEEPEAFVGALGSVLTGR